ncbi:hypothetical protein [Nocardioides bruguierae]|uniref:hypothetical protein n=1 Tax=Nocardioides bruguierae TaxID=2945102 RepID=UPI0020214AA6|nr:hypothetical protein [Nocardioides bruguierae]MCL8026295.1 hypothetical protein [Nocardioides bruguierae]
MNHTPTVWSEILGVIVGGVLSAAVLASLAIGAGALAGVVDEAIHTYGNTYWTEDGHNDAWRFAQVD